MSDLPRPDTSRFSQISPDLLVLSYLLGSKRAISLGTLKTKLKAFVSPRRIEEAVSALVAGHQAIAKKRIELTRKGKDAVEKALGRDAGQGWEKIWHRRPRSVLDDARRRSVKIIRRSLCHTFSWLSSRLPPRFSTTHAEDLSALSISDARIKLNRLCPQ